MICLGPAFGKKKFQPRWACAGGLNRRGKQSKTGQSPPQAWRGFWGGASWMRDATLTAYVLLTLLLLWAAADRWAPYHGQAAACRLGYVYDGDTVELFCGVEKLTARLQGFDTPETKEPKCEAERALGKRATLRLRDLVATGEVAVYRHGYDKYGRVLITLTVAGRDVGDVLITEGLAHDYHGGARGGWCG